MSSFWRSVTSVFMGTLVAQLIPILGSLLIARLYLPESFGEFSVWLGIVMFLAIVLTARFEAALAIEEDGDTRYHAVFATLLMMGGLTVLTCLIITGVCVLAPQWFDSMSFFAFVLLVPTAALTAFAQIWQSWAAAEGAYKLLSLMRIAQAAAITLLQIAMGTWVTTADALVGAYFAGIAVGAALSLVMFPLKIDWRWTILWSTSRAFWVRQKKFPIFSLPADAINTAAAQLPVIIVATRFGAETAGWLAMAMRILGAPIGLLGKAVLDVFKRHAAVSFRDRGECRHEYIRTFQVLGLGSLVFCIGMYFIGESAFALLFGNEWRQAGVIAVWLMPLFAMRFIASPLSYVIYIAEKQHVDLVWQIALLGMTVASLYWTSSAGNAIKVYSLGYSLLYVIYLAMSYRFSLGAKK